MKQILFLALFGFAACGRLDNLYLPPNQRGGSPSTVYGAPSGQYPAVNSQFTGLRGPFPGAASPNIPILRLEDNNNGDGTYNYAYETGNGISAQEQGDTRGGGTKAQGGFSFTATDGQQFQVQYVADENGFQPQGAHIPQIPDAIRRSIEKNLADEARGIVDDGQYRAGPNEQYGLPKTNTPFQKYGPPTKMKTPFQQYGPPAKTNTPFQQYKAPTKASTPFQQYGLPSQQKTPFQQYGSPQQNRQQQFNNRNQYIPPVTSQRNQGGFNY